MAGLLQAGSHADVDLPTMRGSHPQKMHVGFGIGLLSQQAEVMFPGIVIQAVSLTFFVAASLLFAYKTGVIRPTQNFLLIIFSLFGVFILGGKLILIISFILVII